MTPKPAALGANVTLVIIREDAVLLFVEVVALRLLLLISVAGLVTPAGCWLAGVPLVPKGRIGWFP